MAHRQSDCHPGQPGPFSHTGYYVADFFPAYHPDDSPRTVVRHTGSDPAGKTNEPGYLWPVTIDGRGEPGGRFASNGEVPGNRSGGRGGEVRA